METPNNIQRTCTYPRSQTTTLKGYQNNKLLPFSKLDSSYRFLMKTTVFPKTDIVFRCFSKNHPIMPFGSKTTKTKHPASVFSPKTSMSHNAMDMQMQAPRLGTDGIRACQGMSLGTLIISTKRKGDSDNV